MGTLKDSEGRQVSYFVTFTDDKPSMTVYTVEIASRLIREHNVRAVTETLRQWSGSHDDNTRTSEVLASVGPMGPDTFLARVASGETLEREVT